MRKLSEAINQLISVLEMQLISKLSEKNIFFG